MAWTRKLPSGRWQGQYRDPYGQVRSTGSFSRKSEATSAANEQESKVRRGEWIDPTLSRERFDSFASRWLDAKVSKKPKTYASYESTLRLYVLPYFGNQPLATIGREDVTAFVAWMGKQGKSPSTIRKTFRTLSGILNDAVLSDRISRNPAHRIQLPVIEKGDQRLLTPQEIERLAGAIHPRYSALVLLAGYTGLRWAECAGLRVEDLDLREGATVIRRTLSEVGGRLFEVGTKNHRVRVVPLPRFLCRTLDEHVARFVGSDGLVFTSPEGGPLRHNVYKRHFQPALIASGLNPKVRFHDLRHSSASIAGSKTYAGEAAKVVQQMLGHSTQQVTTEVYTHLYPEDFDRLKTSLDAIHEDAVRPEKDDPAAHVLHGADSTIAALNARKPKKAG